MRSSTKPHCFDFDTLVSGNDRLITAQGFGQVVGNLFVPAFLDQRGRRLDVFDVDHHLRPNLQSVNDRFAVGRAGSSERVSVNIHISPLRHFVGYDCRPDRGRPMNRSDFEAAINRFKKKDYSWKLVTPDWYLVGSDGANYPLKFIYAMAIGIHPRDTHTDTAKIAARNAGYEIFDIKDSVSITSADRVTNYWWVNHKQTYRSEIEGGYVWSPKANSNGARNQTYLNLTLVRPGDIVFSYAGAEIRAVGVVTAEHQEQPKPEEFGLTGGNWSVNGWLVPVEWVVLDMPISPKLHLAAIAPLLPSNNSPLQSNGNGNQSCYLASVSVDLGELVLDLACQANPVSIDRLQELEDRSLEDTQQIAIDLDQSISPTEREQLTRARVGQGLFRQRVKLLEKRCRLTGITDTRFLIASHIKPWRNGDNGERLDGHNGLLLAPHVDKLFDRGWISFEDNGDVLIEQSARVVISSWGLSDVTNAGTFTKEQQVFLRFHRARVFKG
jgi:putative restriction endonuclease